MSVYDETRFKACGPVETVERIRAILNDLGIETEEYWNESGLEGFYSVRVSIRGTAIGQNGKGTTKEFARASGYAEFMERLQTGYLLPSMIGLPEEAPRMTAEEIEAQNGFLLRETLREIRRTDGGFDFLPLNAREYLNLWSYNVEDGKIPVRLYTCEETGVTEAIPRNIADAYYYTNGSCAGNTREEALVQGLSEIAERYVTVRLMKKHLTPPVIPDCEIERYPSVYSLVQRIRAHEGIELRIMDASLGMGLPVIAAAMIDRKTGKAAVRFGAHPRFETALERCLTELLQGRNIDRFDHIPVYDISREKDIDSIQNVFNFLKGTFGMFPTELYGREPSWTFTRREEAPEDISGQLRFMREIFRSLSWRIYIRDCSLFGFPTYHIIVPGISMVFDFGAERLWEKRALYRLRHALRNPAEAGHEPVRECRRLAELKKEFTLENTYSFLTGVPVRARVLDEELDAGLFAALCMISEGEYANAAKALEPYCYRNGKMTKCFLLRQLVCAQPLKEASAEALRLIYPKGWFEETEQVLRDPLSVLPVLNCPDCSACAQRDGCSIPNLSRLFKKD